MAKKTSTPAAVKRRAALSFAVGLALDSVTRGRGETKLIAYLAQRAPGEERRGT